MDRSGQEPHWDEIPRKKNHDSGFLLELTKKETQLALPQTCLVLLSSILPMSQSPLVMFPGSCTPSFRNTRARSYTSNAGPLEYPVSGQELGATVLLVPGAKNLKNNLSAWPCSPSVMVIISVSTLLTLTLGLRCKGGRLVKRGEQGSSIITGTF